MSTRMPRFEVARTDAGWHARYHAANGRIVWTTESYTDHRVALHAIGLITGHTTRDVGHGIEVQVHAGVSPHQLLEVRYIDERTEADRG